MMQLAESLGVERNILFHDPVPNRLLPAFYSCCDVFVAPSLYEPFGLVYLEAMSCGAPVVGTTAGGVPEVVADGETGLLVPPGDPEALSAAITRLIVDRALRATLARNGMEIVRQKFTVDHMVQNTLRFYERAAELALARTQS